MTKHTVSYPCNFLWGAATAGHQIEGNNTNSDIYMYENVIPSVFKEKSGLACNSYELWEMDLKLVQAMNLNCYRFSLEWSRIEPSEGVFSEKEIQHYKKIIDGCVERGIEPVVTLCHFSTPCWFAAKGGWTNPNASQWFGAFCEKVSQTILHNVRYVITFNEPNILILLNSLGSIPEGFWYGQKAMLDAAAKEVNTEKFSGINAMNREDFAVTTDHLIKGHIEGRKVIKSYHPALNVGFSLAVFDDQPAGPDSIYIDKQQEIYGSWVPVSKYADFIGVQNYEKVVWDDKGPVKVPDGEMTNFSGSWIDPTSLANSVKTIYEKTRTPIFVTEHGIGTDDDQLRIAFLEQSLEHLRNVISEIPVIGYTHWTLLDNYEWVSGFDVHFGLHSLDPITFERKAKDSAKFYGQWVAKERHLAKSGN
ncbi:family 1 glycosylhydrolase [Vibrio salinus]|uniref:family 1 glycosylhydrolase n=1 Tax=Vibrio salinus TaxID=2899784 RepID=UPI001E425182|nr:family 1 glycosylhydrolase [Vibrio salinus]MCE0493143.1 family 1 glycosylhydrolase [Vibrio salinus]